MKNSSISTTAKGVTIVEMSFMTFIVLGLVAVIFLGLESYYKEDAARNRERHIEALVETTIAKTSELHARGVVMSDIVKRNVVMATKELSTDISTDEAEEAIRRLKIAPDGTLVKVVSPDKVASQ